MPRMNPQPPRQPTRAELERAAALVEYNRQLDSMMPRHFGPSYTCKACGLLVSDRHAHFAWHNESKFYNTLKDLFGDD